MHFARQKEEGDGTRENKKVDGDAKAAARDPPSPRLRRIKGGDEAAGEEGAAPEFPVGAYRKSD